ncbi:hypothetical protein LMIV_2295 [Listeria monocytogenes FSL J1-208]|nr:hypothetical protein LMIV_2295 [Listeria monocytogenes FSL J1-208]
MNISFLIFSLVVAFHLLPEKQKHLPSMVLPILLYKSNYKKTFGSFSSQM